MAIFNFNKVRALEIENEELKTRLFLLKTKEENQAHLDEVLRKLRNNVSDLNESKRVLIDEIEIAQQKIEKQKQQISSLQSDISRLNKQKELHQNDVLELSKKIKVLQEQIPQISPVQTPPSEYSKIDEGRVEHLREEQSSLENKIELITKRINELNVQEIELIERVDAKNKEVLMLERKDIAEARLTIQEIESKISHLKSQETDLIKRIDELTLAEQSKKLILEELDKQLSVTHEETGGLSLKSTTLDKEIQDKLKLFSDTEESYKKLIRQNEFTRKELEHTQLELQNTAQQLSDSTKRMNDTESKIKDLEEIERARKNILSELSMQLNNLKEENKNLESKNIFLMRDNETKGNQLADTEKKYLGILAQYESSEMQLEKIRIQFEQNHINLSRQLDELKTSEIELTSLREEKKQIEELKAEFEHKYDSEKIALDKMLEQQVKLNEMINLLGQRKSELEQSNFAIENRFSKIFQKFNVEYNDLMRKKTLLEQITAKKDKDVSEKDQQLFEKISALEESERILAMRQAEIDSFQQLLKAINEQKELLKNELLKLDEAVLEKKSYNEDIKLESDLLLKKKISVEQTLQEVINTMTDRFEKIKQRRSMLDDDIHNYEFKLITLRNQVDESRKELIEIESSISSRKVEHEDHNGQVVKLISMKKKLEEEIARHQLVLQKYQKIREKLKIEQALIKSRRESAAKTEDELKEAEKSLNEDEQFKIFKI